jgi:hypothetical protein
MSRTPLMFRVTPRGLVPFSDLDWELLNEYKMGSIVHANLVQKKNVGRLRLYWAVLREVQPNTDYPDTKTLSNMLLLATKRVKGWSTLDGREVLIAQDISSMDEQDFADYFEEAMAVIYSEWGIDVEQLKNRWGNAHKTFDIPEV